VVTAARIASGATPKFAKARVAKLSGPDRLLGGPDRLDGAGREAAEVRLHVDVEAARDLGDEALLDRLLAHSHVPADVGPGRPGPAGLVHEVADQAVRDVADVGGDGRGVFEVLERVAAGVLFLDVVDQVVESYSGFRHASTIS